MMGCHAGDQLKVPQPRGMRGTFTPTYRVTVPLMPRGSGWTAIAAVSSVASVAYAGPAGSWNDRGSRRIGGFQHPVAALAITLTALSTASEYPQLGKKQDDYLIV